MKKALVLVMFALSIYASNETDSLPTPPMTFDVDSGNCNTQTTYRVARYNQCAYNNEVVTGIQSLNPLVVVCSGIIVSCYKLDPFKNHSAKLNERSK